MSRLRKAVITAAGRGTRQYPASSTVQKEMMPLVDVDGLTKPTIQVIAEEALESGIDEILIVANPENLEPIRRHFRPLSREDRKAFAGKDWALKASDRLADLERRISFVVQETQDGYGHAVYQAREWVGDEPCLVLLGDHVYLSRSGKRCARQVIEVFQVSGCSVSAVQRTPQELLHLFGTVGGRRIASDPDVYEVERIIEKPSVDVAEAELMVEGLRCGYFLCFFGMHAFTPGIFEALEYHIQNDLRERGEIQLTSAQEWLRERERYVAFEAEGQRYDMGVPFGFIETQMALAVNSRFRDQILASLVKIITANVSVEDPEIW